LPISTAAGQSMRANVPLCRYSVADTGGGVRLTCNFLV